MSAGAITTVALIGLGKMGTPIAHHLLAAGYRLIVWDHDPVRVAALAGMGAVAASGPSDVAGASALVSVVLDDAATLEVAATAAKALAPGAVHLAMATVAPTTARSLAALHVAVGQRYLSAPMFGRPEAATAGRLRVVCSGDRATFDEVRVLLAPLGEVDWIGEEPSLAMLVKLAGNNLIFGVVELMDEVFDLLGAGGMVPAEVRRHLLDRLLPGEIFQGYAERRVHDAGATDLRRVSGKDNRLCLDAARAAGVELPLVEAVGRVLFDRPG